MMPIPISVINVLREFKYNEDNIIGGGELLVERTELIQI